MINLALTKEKRRKLYLKTHPEVQLEEKERRMREQSVRRRKIARLKKVQRIVDLRCKQNKTFQEIAKSVRPRMTNQRIQQIFKKAIYDGTSTNTSNLCAAR